MENTIGPVHDLFPNCFRSSDNLLRLSALMIVDNILVESTGLIKLLFCYGVSTYLHALTKSIDMIFLSHSFEFYSIYRKYSALSFWSGLSHPWIRIRPQLKIGISVLSQKLNSKQCRSWWDAYLEQLYGPKDVRTVEVWHNSKFHILT